MLRNGARSLAFCLLQALVVSTGASAAPLPADLVAAYGFEEGVGDTTADASGHGHTARLLGPTWTRTGRFGTALELDGKNDRARVAQTPLLDPGSALTLTAWVRPRALSERAAVVVKARPAGIAYALYVADGPGRPPAGYVHVQGADLGVVGTTALPLDQWTHLALTYDGSALRLYVDGALVATRAASGAIPDSPNALQMGGDGSRESLRGALDEVRLYARALDAAEVARDRDTAVACPGRAGFDPVSRCVDCAAGFRLVGRDGADGDFVGSIPLAPYCERMQTCAELDCGAHGQCAAASDGDATCACDIGWAGSRCEACAPPFEPFAGNQCVLGPLCAATLCGGHGACVLGRAGGVACRCDTGWDLDAECGGPSIAIGADDGPLHAGIPADLSVGLRHGLACTTGFVWTIERGGGHLDVDPLDSRRARYTPGREFEGRVGRATVRAACANNPSVGVSRDLTVAGPTAPGDRPRWVDGGCDGRLAELADEAMLEWIEANGMTGGTLGISYLGRPVCLRSYGYREVDMTPSGVNNLPMRTCTPMRVASVTKSFTRAALRGNLYGTPLPPDMSGGTLGDSSLVLPIIDGVMSLGPGGSSAWISPASLYSVGWGIDLDCNFGTGQLDSAWALATLGGTLKHKAGFQPNQSYQLGNNGPCTGAPGEACKDFRNVNDPTVSASASERIANDLGIVTHGVPTIDDVLAWMSGVCMYDSEAFANSRYSNLGYSIAGRIVELVSGQSWQNFVLGFLDTQGLIDLGFSDAGRPIAYRGRNQGNGPASFALPSYMSEARYYSHIGTGADVTFAQKDENGTWEFPNTAPAPYGLSNYDLMYAHGGMVTNPLALLNLSSRYLIGSGTPRKFLFGGFVPEYDASTAGNQGGLLWGTSSLLAELGAGEPTNPTNPNGTGCLIPADKTDADDPNGNGNGLDALAVAPCPLPWGLTVAAIFNGDPVFSTDPAFVRGRHDGGLLGHMLRRALSQFGGDATTWLAVKPLTQLDLDTGCSLKCGGLLPFCVPIDCGNGVLEPGEQCDDGNNLAMDGCAPDCTIPPPAPTSPPSYAACEGEAPGECLGGPCAAREEQFVSDTDRLNPDGPAHPDGDFSAHTFCHDSLTLGLPWEEAVCRREKYGNTEYGVCRECGVDTMIGCRCPAPNAEDGGCNDIVESGLSCIGDRCWKDLPPSWMCTANCTDIYGSSGYCHHDSAKGAVCYSASCDEPVTHYCDVIAGAVCNPNVDGCEEDGCCVPECLADADCTALGYVGHFCHLERCVLTP